MTKPGEKKNKCICPLDKVKNHAGRIATGLEFPLVRCAPTRNVKGEAGCK